MPSLVLCYYCQLKNTTKEFGSALEKMIQGNSYVFISVLVGNLPITDFIKQKMTCRYDVNCLAYLYITSGSASAAIVAQWHFAAITSKRPRFRLGFFFLHFARPHLP